MQASYLAHDPLRRLLQLYNYHRDGAISAVRFDHYGDRLITEIDVAGAIARRSR